MMGAEVEGRVCSSCQYLKSAEHFYKTPNGLRSQCKACMAKRNRAARRAGKMRVRDRRANIRRHGIEPHEYDKRLAEQNGQCAACGQQPVGDENLHIHHDHKCCGGQYSCGSCVVALLCHGCNLALGHLGDDAKRAMLLAAFAVRVEAGE